MLNMMTVEKNTEVKENNKNASNLAKSHKKSKEKSMEKFIKPICSQHEFSANEKVLVRSKLLRWFKKEARELPWRSAADPTSSEYQTDPDTRGYMVWVSEVMLQQTQVATVIDYYRKWMSKWPTIESLSKASLESINEVWSGLGYYSRARRLQEGSHKIMMDYGGQMPRTKEQLLKLPGVGKYTAAAVASIAYGEVGGLVDGNVIRVLARLRCIGEDISNSIVTETMWKLAESLVDSESPGDFNQAMMELGATVCTPKAPSCNSCPVNTECLARNLNQTREIEDCSLCLSKEKFEPALGVLNYPRKTKKTSSRTELMLVAVVHSKLENQYAMVRRPKTGLLANLLEFPSIGLDNEDTKENVRLNILTDFLGCRGIQVTGLDLVGPVVHIFSHINMTYIVYKGVTESKCDLDEVTWVSSEEFDKCGTSTAMKKVFKSIHSNIENDKKRKRNESADKKQTSISAFFSPRIKKEKS